MPQDPDGAQSGSPGRLLRRLFDQLRRRAQGAVLRLRQLQALLRDRLAHGAREQLTASLALAVADVSRLTAELEMARDALSASQAGLETALARRTAELSATNEALRREVAARLESEGRLRVLLDGIPQLVWRADGQGRWTWCSPQWIATTGLSKDRSLGEGWLEAVHPDDRAATWARWNAATPEAPYEGESRLFSRPHGRHRWFQHRAASVRGETGEVVEWLGASTDIHVLRELQERQRVLVAELQHRTRNLLAVTRGIAHQTIDEAGSLAEFRALLDDRMRPLSEVQSLLSRSDAEPITLEALLRLELAAVGAEDERVLLAGPAVTLRNAAVQTLALALHELATNARKHGALTSPAGRLTIRWATLGDTGQGRLRLDWIETGVALASGAAAHMGYGRELIEHALPYSLGAKTGFSLEADGLKCFIDLPLQ